MEKYNPQEIEAKWQNVWEKLDYGKADDFSSKPKHYHLVEFPYPSGAGLHVGHCMGYGASDAYCRMKRMQGYNVMYPIGWDAFGLPTENYAIKTGTHPSKVTAESIVTFKKQIKSLGYSFDWSREVNTTDPEYYKWTQWIFLQFYKHAIVDGKLIEVEDDDTATSRLAYQKEMPINWCPSCKIGLANEEVISGNCERCGTQTEKRMQKQWLLRITAYADRLIKDLDTVDYLDKIKTQQVNWIGRSEGINIDYQIEGLDQVLTVFTTRPDTNFGATFVVAAPDSEFVRKNIDRFPNNNAVLKYVQEASNKSDIERITEDREKTGVFTGLFALNGLNNKKMPIYISDFVLAGVGTGIVVGVPGHDIRDFEFAQTMNLEIIRVVVGSDGDTSPITEIRQVQEEEGVMVNSGFLDGMDIHEATKKIMDYIEKKGLGKRSVNYKLRDWIFSRQHYWGEPIPIIHCDKCGMVPMDESDLPLTLPDVENYQPTDTGESPIAKITGWVNTTCPKCGGKAKHETDTMPNWAGSSWYFLAYAMQGKNSKSEARNPKQIRNLKSETNFKNLNFDIRASDFQPVVSNFDIRYSNLEESTSMFAQNKDELNYWLPVDIYNGGMEHTTLHLLYSRFWHKFLFDLGVVPGPEPYAKRIAHGIILGPDGQKMSKSKGNVINPDDMVMKFGADTLRAYIMFIGPYDQESAWSMAGIQGVSRFLNRLWNNQEKVAGESKDNNELLVKLNQTIKGVTDDIENFRMNTVVSKLMEMNNAIEKAGSISEESYRKYLKLLFAVVPHIAEELWRRLDLRVKPDDDKQGMFEDGEEEKLLIENAEWPKADQKYLVSEKIEIVVQVNGKVRDRIKVASNISDQEIKEIALSSDKIKEIISDKEIIKTIVVPKKLVSIVVR